MKSPTLKMRKTACTDCGRTNIGCQEKCLVCSGELGVECLGHISGQDTTQNSETFSICNSCGVSLMSDMVFCTNCGTEKVAKVEALCGVCGTAIQPAQLFCTECGERVQ